MRVCNQLRGMTLCALSLCILPFISSWAYGSIINYTDVSGTKVTYTNISEEPTRETLPGPDNPLPKFGQPTGGDTLSFPLESFYTQSSGIGFDTCDSNLKMWISTKSNTTGIDKVVLDESGEYQLLRSLLSSDPLAEVNAVGFLKVTKINGASVTPIDVNVQFDKVFHLTGAQTVTSPFSTPWDGSLVFNVKQALIDKGISGYATEARLSLDNVLLSKTDAENSFSKIIKKSVDLTTTTIDVPEPSVLIMLAIGVLGLGIWRRKN